MRTWLLLVALAAFALEEYRHTTVSVVWRGSMAGVWVCRRDYVLLAVYKDFRSVSVIAGHDPRSDTVWMGFNPGLGVFLVRYKPTTGEHW